LVSSTGSPRDPSLYTDGAEALYDFAERAGDTPEARSARELVVFERVNTCSPA
jgi:hypothetical protein